MTPPKLTREEACVCAGLRRLLGALFPPPPAHQPADLRLILKELKSMSDMFDTEMTKLRGDVAAQSTVIASATEAFRGLTARLVAAEAEAKNAGATDAQVAGVTTLRQQLEANTASLAAAIPANTEPPTPAPVTTPATPADSSSSATVPPTPTTETQPDPATLAANQSR